MLATVGQERATGGAVGLAFRARIDATGDGLLYVAHSPAAFSIAMRTRQGQIQAWARSLPRRRASA